MHRGAGVQCALQEGNGGGAIGHGVVHLGDDAEPTVSQSVDYDNLPQRTISGQWSARHVGHHCSKLTVSSRLAGEAAGDMSSQVEVGILDPHRVPESPWDRHHPSTKWGESVEPVAEELHDLVV